LLEPRAALKNGVIGNLLSGDLNLAKLLKRNLQAVRRSGAQLALQSKSSVPVFSSPLPTNGSKRWKPVMASDQDLYHELAFYTLAHSDPSFLHQHIVDAYAAQHADENTKPIVIVFALVGLYLHLEKNLTGRQVQRFHMKLAKIRRQWVKPEPPKERGAITVQHVLAAAEGPSRDALIDRWCASVWEAWNESHDDIANLARIELGIL
jgi:hypothetical protein